MPDSARFIFATCQIGAESVVKAEVARHLPDLRFSYSRPGFLTFRVPEGRRLVADFDLPSVFTRAKGICLGRVSGDDADAMVRRVWEIYGTRPVRRVHVWPRDLYPSGEHDFEPIVTDASREIHAKLIAACPGREHLGEGAAELSRPAAKGEFVCDCVLVAPDEWWVGFHRAKTFHSTYPGGLLDLQLPADAASRAWLKFEEGLRWAAFPLTPGARCVDIGCSPGGSSQALLSRGLSVLGIDPADMASQVLEHPAFTHVRKRAADVKKRDLQKMRWLTADMNVAPAYTLDVLESIVTHPRVRIRGLLFTLKLFNWAMADQMPDYLERVATWGYNKVKAKQLQFNRQEICVAALQRPFRKK